MINKAWPQSSLLDRVRWLRFILPPLLVCIVVFYQLVEAEKTVRNQLTTLYRKLHLGNRTQAALYAMREGLVDP